MHQLLGTPQPFVRWETALTQGARTIDVEVWTSSSGCAPTSQDAWLVHDAENRIRLAALDGVTPTSATPSVAGLDGAAWAARVTAAALEAPLTAVAALEFANAELLSRPGTLRLLHRDRPHTMAAVVDITAGVLDVTVAGDCQVFVGFDDAWRELFGGALFTAPARERWTEWHRDHPEAHPLDGIAQGYEEILADPDAWRSTAIGLFANAHFQHTTIPDDEWDHVVVASDGARLTETSVVHLEAWLDQLRQHEAIEYAGDLKPHDDVVVISGRMKQQL